MNTELPNKEKTIREPSLVDALIPLLFMIALLATSIVLFGIDAAVGPLQVALLMSGWWRPSWRTRTATPGRGWARRSLKASRLR
jgi:hypothetical protein